MVEIFPFKELDRRVSQILSNSHGDRSHSLVGVGELLEDSLVKERPEAIAVPRSKHLQAAVGGLRIGDHTAICGSTGSGKTTLLTNWSLGFIGQDVPTYTASIEIGGMAYLAKMASALTGRRGPETREEWQEIKDRFGATHFSSPKHQFSTYSSRVGRRQMMADIVFAKEKHDTKVVILDNYNFVSEVSNSREAVTEMDRAVHDWIVFIREIGVHMIQIFHPRKSDRQDGERVLSIYDLKGSSTAVQESQNVFLFNRLEKAEHAPFGKDPNLCRELKVAKCRSNGRAVGKRIIYAIDPESEAYSEVRILRDAD